MTLRALLLAAPLLAAPLLTGCGAAPRAPSLAPRHDMPVPPGEPRAELRLRVDLAPGAGCEEDLDLALYRDRGVDLIQWDEHTGACAGRTVTIRYLPRRTSAEKILSAVQKLGARAEQMPAAPQAEP